jgi:hypothetical protein
VQATRPTPDSKGNSAFRGIVCEGGFNLPITAMTTIHGFEICEHEFNRERVALGNGTAFYLVAGKLDAGFFFAVEGFGAFTFSGTPTHSGYVAEKLNLTRFMGDAEILTQWLNEWFQGKH